MKEKSFNFIPKDEEDWEEDSVGEPSDEDLEELENVEDVESLDLLKEEELDEEEEF